MVDVLPGATIIDAGVDWLTATAKEVDECEALVELGSTVLDQLRQGGYSVRTAGFQGYRGYGTNGGFVGTRKDGACLRLSGATAHQTAGRVAALGCKVTRVDYQVTVLAEGVGDSYARCLIDAARDLWGGENSYRERYSQLVDAASNGSTAYFGRRTAPRFGRIYDKHRETRGSYPPGAWRIEAECKRRLATPAFYKLAEYGYSREAVAGFVREFYRGFGLSVPIPPDVRIDMPVVERVTPDLERKLEWLLKTVRPVVKELYDAGRGVEAAEALYGWLMPEPE